MKRKANQRSGLCFFIGPGPGYGGFWMPLCELKVAICREYSVGQQRTLVANIWQWIRGSNDTTITYLPLPLPWNVTSRSPLPFFCLECLHRRREVGNLQLPLQPWGSWTKYHQWTVSSMVIIDVFPLNSGFSETWEKSSVGDPDPHVFGPPGSGSISQWYGSGIGSFPVERTEIMLAR